ncbi:MAG: HEAT repeat domain-containing protein [Spirulinaceae cyanobacterium RM2_2_10]|nr:HEAT repeat domain-containing protein [Spirulinaceae cyanobacterium SM2_1_0]NJO19398.1 HEAT repeat domain-containing protein [Spirulinaceae cyanobacterium RM2_2_10]
MTADCQAQIAAINRAASSEALIGAVRSLAAQQSPAAIPKLIEVLGYNNPGAAVAAVDGLIQLGAIAVQPILDTLDGYDYGARAWASRALAKIGDPRALENLLAAAQGDFALSVRRAAAQGLGQLDWAQLPEAECQVGQQRVLTALLNAVQDDEWVVRYAAIAGLQSLAQAAPYLATSITARLQQAATEDPDLAIQGDRAGPWSS